MAIPHLARSVAFCMINWTKNIIFLSAKFKDINLIFSSSASHFAHILTSPAPCWCQFSYLHFWFSKLLDLLLPEFSCNHAVHPTIGHTSSTPLTLTAIGPAGPGHLQAGVVGLLVTVQLTGQAEVNHCRKTLAVRLLSSILDINGLVQCTPDISRSFTSRN